MKTLIAGLALVGAAALLVSKLQQRRGLESEAGAVEPGLDSRILGALDFSRVVQTLVLTEVDTVDANKNVAAFLQMIRKAEGTGGANGYRTIFGGELFNSFSDHPRRLIQFKQTDGKVNFSSAAGAYQFLTKTWDRLKNKLGLIDFSPQSQDAAAVALIEEAGALDDVRGGRFESALGKCSRIWASLPGSPYPQPKRSIDYVLAAYREAGGVVV